VYLVTVTNDIASGDTVLPSHVDSLHGSMAGTLKSPGSEFISSKDEELRYYEIDCIVMARSR
jgi:hypothetical protein